MNHYENKEAKKYLAAAVIVAVFAAAVVGMVMFAQGERQRRLENVAFYALLAEVQKTSPQTDGKRLMHILNHAENYRETDFVLLRQQYGLTGESRFCWHRTSPDRSDVFCNSDSDCRRRAADWDFFFLSDETEKEDRGIVRLYGTNLYGAL